MNVEIVSGLVLKDPLMIASSHWTAKESAFKALQPFSPSAVTLKTVSARYGGNGVEAPTRERIRHQIITSDGAVFGAHVDGPKKIELWDVPTAKLMLKKARGLLRDSKIGLSVLHGEDYVSIAKKLKNTEYEYVELNWKYSFRDVKPSDVDEHQKNVILDLRSFLDTFKSLPKLLKLSRESLGLIESQAFVEVLKCLDESRSGLIVANSKRLTVPPSRVQYSDSNSSWNELSQGVIVGDYLFPETYTAIKQINAVVKKHKLNVPMVATGGVTDVGSIIDSFAAGASAVQLCTALDLYNPLIIDEMRDALRNCLSKDQHLPAFISALGVGSEVHQSILSGVARRYRFRHKQTDSNVAKLLDDGRKLTGLLVDALKMEVYSSAVPDDDRGGAPSPGKKMRIVVARSNALSFLLAKRLSVTLGLDPIEIRFAGELKTLIAEEEDNYDFAIVSSSILEFFKSEGNELGDKAPKALAMVGKSITQLMVPLGSEPKDIERVIRLPGTTIDSAVNRLLEQYQPDIVDCHSDKLLDIVSGSKKEAFLVKSPLSFIYRELLDERCKYEAKWQAPEDLVLISTTRLQADSKTMQYCRYVVKVAAQELAKIDKAPMDAVKDLVKMGFVDHIASLLNFKKVWRRE